MATWWSYGAEVFFALSRLGLPYDDMNKKPRFWNVAGFDFRLGDADVIHHEHEMEEALWAIKRGLS